MVIDVASKPPASASASASVAHQAPNAMASVLASLREASELHSSGALTDAEFADIKAQLLKDPR